MPLSSLPFVFDYVKDIGLEKFSEILSRNADMDIIVNLYSNANAVALADAEATGKHNLVFYVMFFNGFFEQLNYILRSFEVAG